MPLAKYSAHERHILIWVASISGGVRGGRCRCQGADRECNHVVQGLLLPMVVRWENDHGLVLPSKLELVTRRRALELLERVGEQPGESTGKTMERAWKRFGVIRWWPIRPVVKMEQPEALTKCPMQPVVKKPMLRPSTNYGEMLRVCHSKWVLFASLHFDSHVTGHSSRLPWGTQAAVFESSACRSERMGSPSKRRTPDKIPSTRLFSIPSTGRIAVFI